jgi:hypothetical protein
MSGLGKSLWEQRDTARPFWHGAETLDDAKTIAEHHYAATAQEKAARKPSGATGGDQGAAEVA